VITFTNVPTSALPDVPPSTRPFGIFSSGNRPPAGAITPSYQNGWARITFDSPIATAGIVSLAGSASLDMGTNAITTGRFRVRGLPAVGLFARNFVNGTLDCAAGKCQGNYGSAFAHKSFRVIEPAP
jgi:hypothetical protein